MSRFLLSTRIILDLDILLPFIIHISRIKWIMCCGDLSNYVGYAKDRKLFLNVFKYLWEKDNSKWQFGYFFRSYCYYTEECNLKNNLIYLSNMHLVWLNHSFLIFYRIFLLPSIQIVPSTTAINLVYHNGTTTRWSIKMLSLFIEKT